VSGRRRESWRGERQCRLGRLRKLSVDGRQKAHLIKGQGSVGWPNGQRCARHDVSAVGLDRRGQRSGVKVNAIAWDACARRGSSRRYLAAANGRADAGCRTPQAERDGQRQRNNRNDDVLMPHRVHLLPVSELRLLLSHPCEGFKEVRGEGDHNPRKGNYTRLRRFGAMAQEKLITQWPVYRAFLRLRTWRPLPVPIG
jgi:hypothetical protein